METPGQNQRVKVFVKRRLRYDLLNFDQREMVRLGTLGIAELLNRIDQGKSAEDTGAKPLSRAYAKRKTKAGLGGRRNLRYLGLRGGHMLDNLRVRTVSSNEVRSGFSTKKLRDKALGNSKIEPFLLFSPRNQRRIAEEGRRILVQEKMLRLAIQKSVPL